MTTKEVLEILKARGIRVVLEDGRPVLKSPPAGSVTPELLAVLKFHRQWIIEMLKRSAKPILRD